MNFKNFSNSKFNEGNSKTNEFGITQNVGSDKSLLTNWLSPEEVCHILRISKRTLQTYRDSGILPFSQISRKIYFKASDVEEYLEAHYIKANYQKEGAA